MPRPQNEKENLQFIQELAEVDGPFESPININYLDLTKLELPPLCWNRSDVLPKKMKLTNTGHTVILSGRWNRERPYLTGGPLEGNYVFSQVHFHWGPDNCRGSEHTVCGEKFPLEMHVAHFKTEYSTQECALQEKDGMVVLVYLFKLQDEPNASLRKILNALPCIQEASTSVSLDPKPLLALCNPFTDDFFMYWGSVVTSTCAHILMWIICREPFGISREQMEEFRKVMDCTQRPIQRNNRDTQPLHGRNIFHINPSRCVDKPLLPIKKIMGCFCSDMSDQKETGDSKRRSSSRACCCNANNNNSSNNNNNNNNNNNKPQSQEEIEDKETKSCRPSNQQDGMYNRQMVYVQHATIHSNHVFKKQYHTGDNNPVQQQKEDLKENEEVSQSCCFLPIKKELKDDEKERRKEKASRNKERKKSFDSVKALSNIIDSLEGLKNHTYKKLQELESINLEIKELKKHCEEPNEQRWLRKMEKIITRQKRYTLRTSRCCFGELKKLAKEYNIDKVLEKKMIPSGEEERNFSFGENELQDVKSDRIDSPVTCYNVCKQEKFSKKAQKLIKSFFEDIQENEEAQKTLQKDLELRKMSRWKLDDETRTQASSADGSKVLITQQMFKLGDFGNRFFTEVTPEEKEIKIEVEGKKRTEKENGEISCKKGKHHKVIPLHRTDVVFKFRNKQKLKKSSSSSSVLIVDSNESEKKIKKKKSKHPGKKKENKPIHKGEKKNAKTQYVSLSSEETSEEEMKLSVISKRKSRKDLWENQSVMSVRPVEHSSKKKKDICEKNVKRKFDKKESPRKETVVERTDKSSEKSYAVKDGRLEKLQISPERKKLKLDQKENNKHLLPACKCEDAGQSKIMKEITFVEENQVHSTEGYGDSVDIAEILLPSGFDRECEGNLKETIEGQDFSKRSWTAPSAKARDNSGDKKSLVTSPNPHEKLMQRRATSPVLIYHSANKKSMEGSKTYRYEIHNHENPGKTFIENWSAENERPIIKRFHFPEKELKEEKTYRETDSNDSNYEKFSKIVKSDVTILSLRSSENEETRKDNKSRTMSAESFNSSRTVHKKKRRQRQSRKNSKTPSTVRMLDTIESSRLEFSNLTEDQQLQIISSNVASFLKQKLLEHKRYIESQEKSDQFNFCEVEQAVLRELKSIGASKNEEEDTDTMENQWSTSALKVPSVKQMEKPEPKSKEPENEVKKKPTTKPIHNFIRKNKLLAGKYKRKVPPKKPDGPKKVAKPPTIKSTEPTTSSDNKSPVRVVKPHACNPIFKSPEEKSRDRSASVQKQRVNSAKNSVTPKETDIKRPTTSKDSPKLQPTVPPAIQKIPRPKKRWVPTYTLTSYLHTPLDIVENQSRKFLLDKEDKVEKFDLNTNDLEYLIKLEMCINNEIATNMENSMNYVKALVSQDYNGTAIIEKPPLKDSFNIFDPINNNGILLIELHDSGNMTENVTDYETSETRYSYKKLKKSRRKRRRNKKKWSELNRVHESGDQSVPDSDNNSNSSDLDTKGSEKSESDNKDVSHILKKYIYHLGRGEESNIDLTERRTLPIEEEPVPNFKPHIKKRKEKSLLSSEIKEKLLEVLTEEMKQEFESKEKTDASSSTERNSMSTEETVTCECERTEMWAKMLKNFLKENNNEDENSKNDENEESDIKKSEGDTSRSFDDYNS